tara:strand:+ start:147 stop:377 length:231 start_codon:yes stop_codon:yes gene_type:complete
MGFIFKPPSMPSVPQLEMPKTENVPSWEDKERERLEAQKLLDTEKKRKGRRSTILTGTGLNPIEEANLKTTTLLGG